MVFNIDEPPVLCRMNLGANPVEYLLVALSGCLTTSMIAHAAARGIEIRKVESRYEGDLDVRGVWGYPMRFPWRTRRSACISKSMRIYQKTKKKNS